ncbi:MAG: hypothetical protein R2706_09065 [Acidimicrobiales bacterium]
MLLETRIPLSADELREQVEGYPEAGPAFKRAFERDKEDLRTLGIPITVGPVPFSDPPIEGYRVVPDEYYLPDPGSPRRSLRLSIWRAFCHPTR